MRKSLVFLLMFCFVAAFFFPAANHATAAEPERYGYKQLTNETQRTAYNEILAGVGAVKRSITFEARGSSSDIFANIKAANEMVTKDYPELFWYDGSYNVSVSGSTVTVTPGKYTVAGKTITTLEELKPYKLQLDQAVNKALANIKSNYSDYEIAHTFHDYMVQNVDYIQEGDHQSAYGSLVGGKAVCAGYTRGYQLLLNRAGIPSFYISGTSYGPNGQLYPHAWNLVWLDGNCYYSDTTWDDQSNDLFHEYLNLSKEEISNTHFTEDPLPPSCGHDDYTFFVKNDTDHGVCDFHGHKTIEEVAGCFQLKSLEGGVATYYCTIHYHGEDFNHWLNQVKSDLFNLLQLTGSIKFNVIELGLEHHVTISGTPKSELPPAVTPSDKPQPETAPGGQQRPNTGDQIEYPTQAPKPVTPPDNQSGNTQQQQQKPTQAPVKPNGQTPTQSATVPSTNAPVQNESVPATNGATQGTGSNDATNSENGTSSDMPTNSDKPDEQGSDDKLMYIVYGIALVGLAAGGFLLYKKLKAN